MQTGKINVENRSLTPHYTRSVKRYRNYMPKFTDASEYNMAVAEPIFTNLMPLINVLYDIPIQKFTQI